MKVLYIGHFKNGNSGWSKAATDYLLAMDSVGIDVVPRDIKLSNSEPNLPVRYYELEKKSSIGCDVVIQHVLPHHLVYDGHFKQNIALCVYELGGTWYHNWSSKINMMDKLWVPTTYTRNVFHDGGVKIPIQIVPHTFNMDKYTKEYAKIEEPSILGNYVFYTIADANARKNLMKIIQAFHLEFTINEPVSLIIKANRFGVSPEELFQGIGKDCSQVKRDMKLYTKTNNYKSEFLITSNLTDEQLMEIHNSGDCYVNASHGEAWCIPLFEAMAMGKQIVCPDNMYDFIDTRYCATFNTYEDCATRCLDTFPELSTARETWRESSVPSISKCMRNEYQHHLIHGQGFVNSIAQRIARSKDYSYDKIGTLIKEFLNV